MRAARRWWARSLLRPTRRTHDDAYGPEAEKASVSAARAREQYRLLSAYPSLGAVVERLAAVTLPVAKAAEGHPTQSQRGHEAAAHSLAGTNEHPDGPAMSPPARCAGLTRQLRKDAQRAARRRRCPG